MKPGLREGFTTGTAAAAAAKAAARALLTGRLESEIEVPLPVSGRLRVPVAAFDFKVTAKADRAPRPLVEAGAEAPRGERRCRAFVVKDAGDDPDVTHGAKIDCLVRLDPAGEPGAVVIEGGEGVGRVTLPGLPVPVGRPAINPGPLRQIAAAVREEAEAAGFGGAIAVLVGVEDGRELARKTMNPRLGIVGGLSILGESGVVKPYSRASWKASVAEALDVARAMGLSEAVLTTGRRAERFHRERFPESPLQGLVQMADFFAFSLHEAALRGFDVIFLSCFFGKLAKMAMGLEYTHANAGDLDFGLLAALAGQAGGANGVEREILCANTARQVLELTRGMAWRPRFLELVARRALEHARGFAGPGPRLGVRLFDFDGELLAEIRDPGE